MTASADKKIGGIVLAAGGSKRFGEPKQFLVFEGKTLLRRAVEAMIDSVCEPVVVVLGAEFERAKDEIAVSTAHVCVNENWQTGMSSSIKAGLAKLLKVDPESSAVLIILCDQPFVTSDNINSLAAKFTETGKAIVASEYNDTIGVPALFSSELFDTLSRIEGDKGARELIRSNAGSIAIVSIPEAAFDIDTTGDAEALLH